MNEHIRIILVDDHQLIIDGLKGLISEDDGINCVGTANNGVEALYLIEHLKVDVVLLDHDMPKMNGLQATEKIKQRWPEVRVLMLSMHDEAAVVKRIMDAGADGYLIKDSPKAEILAGINAVNRGGKHFSSKITEALLNPENNVQNGSLSSLTSREIEVLTAVSEGLSNKEIGERLFISPRTVDTHRSKLMKKLGVHNVASLVRIAIRAGLVD